MSLNIFGTAVVHLTESESCSVVSDSLQPHGDTVHQILQVRILEWVAFPFSTGSSQPRDLPNPGIKLRSPTLQADSLPAEPQGKPKRQREKCLKRTQRSQFWHSDKTKPLVHFIPLPNRLRQNVCYNWRWPLLSFRHLVRGSLWLLWQDWDH